jgi:hypothetical protein
MCTVLIRFAPGDRWPLLLGAVRDEFADRAWDPPGRFWTGPAQGLIGGRDRAAGGTWLAVDPGGPAVAALVNGPNLDAAPGREPGAPPAAPVPPRPTRGDLALAVLATGTVPDADQAARYNGFHLLVGRPDRLEIYSWDGVAYRHREIEPGDHILVNHGLDTNADPLVPHFHPLLAATGPVQPEPGLPTDLAWAGWLRLLAGDGLDPQDPRALLVRAPWGERVYASTSATLVGLGWAGVRYDFTAEPTDPAGWYEVRTGVPSDLPAT